MITFDEVCRFVPLSVVSKLIRCTQFEPLWVYMTVRTSRRRCSLFLSDITNRIGGECLIHSTVIVTGGLMPSSWAARWTTTGTLILRPPRLPSLTSALLSLHVGHHVLDMLVKKYGKSSCRSVTPPWSCMNLPSNNRDYTVTESATWLW